MNIDNEPTRPSLGNLAAELLEGIAQHLKTEDFRQFRLVSRGFYTSTFHVFAKRHFSMQRTDLSRASLGRFQAFCAHSKLASYVKHLTITAEVTSGGVFFADGFDWRRSPSGQLVIPQNFLNGWKDALQRMPNCTSFRLKRPLNVCLETIMDDLDGPDDPEPESTFPALTPTETFMALQRILGAARTLVEEFELLFIWNHPLQMSSIDISYLQNPSFITSWSKLRKFEMQVKVSTDAQADYIAQLVTMASSLEYLSLNVDFGNRTGRLIRNLSSMATATGDGPNRRPPPFKLKEIRLRTACITLEELCGFLTHHRGTVHTLVLGDIHLSPGGTIPFLRALRDDGFSALRALTLQYLCECTGSGGNIDSHMGVVFPGIGEAVGERALCYVVHDFGTRTRPLAFLSYEGTNMVGVLQRLVDTVRIVAPQ
ncbi:hypothetical protein BDW75DRAFT_243208 [Aspergillus navahoensis]